MQERAYEEGRWGGTGEGFAGFMFGNLYRYGSRMPNFGWLHFKIDIGPQLFANNFTLIDWAYQSVPGELILAGDKGNSVNPVPEPSTLALMALGAVGMGTLRRQRNREHSKHAH